MKTTKSLRITMKAVNIIVILMTVISQGGWSIRRATADTLSPYIEADPGGDWVHVRGWSDGTQLTLTIDDPTNGIGIDKTVTATVGPASWNINDIVADFNLDGFDLRSGQILNVTDGGTPPTVDTYVPTNIAITGVDVATDIISGIATPGVQVHVCANTPGNCVELSISAAAGTGLWTADFSGLVDIQPGSDGWSSEQDGNGNTTHADWNVPNPYVEANINNSRVQGRDWPVGDSVTLTIDDPSTGVGVDYTATTTFGQNPENPDPNDQIALFRLNGLYDLKAGDIVTLSDGSVTRTITVTSLVVTTADPASDTVSGTAAPGSEVQVWVNASGPAVNRGVTTGVDGKWSADFATAGPRDDEKVLFDIVPGTNGGAKQIDNQGDTWTNWRVINPYIEANPGSNWVHGRDWPIGTSLTLTIDDPSNGTGVDKTVIASVEQDPGDPNNLRADFNLDGFDLLAGQILKVTDGATPPTERTYTASNLAITGFGLLADTISGVATPGLEVHVCVNMPGNCISRYVIAASVTGIWTADYGHPGVRGDEQQLVDLQPGNNGWAAEGDVSGNQTWADWRVPNPYIEANPGSNWVHGRDWPNGTPLTLTIDDPTNGTGIDKTVTATVGPASWNPNDMVADFNLNGYDLQSGQTLNVTDGATPSTERTYVPSNLAITGFDLVADTISGTATPGLQVRVCVNIPNNCIHRYVTAAAGTGIWTADYGHPGTRNDEQQLVDLQPGSNGNADESDASGNQTWADWRVPNPWIEADSGNNWVRAHEWPDGTLLTLTIDDPTNGVGVDKTVTATMGPPSWNPNEIVAEFDLSGFDLQGGQILNVSDGATPPSERTYTVSDLTITGFDLNAETVSGIATPGVEVHVCANIPNSCVSRYVTAAAGTGIWTADYAHPGARNDEQQLVDLQYGNNGWATEQDGSGNQTRLDWNVPYAPFIHAFYLKASAESNWVHAYGWQDGVDLTLEVDNPTNGVGVDYSTSTTTGAVSWDSRSPVPDSVGVFDLSGAYDLEVGDEVTVIGAGHTETYAVQAKMTQVRWFIGLGTGMDPTQIPTELQVVDDFNSAYSNYELIAEIVPNTSGRNVLAAEIADGTGPDLVGPVGVIGSNTFHGQWLDLAPLINSTSFDTSIFDPALMTMSHTEEGQVGLPVDVFPSAMYYNPALFDAAQPPLHYPPAHYGDKYQMPDGSIVDWNWDTLTKVAKLLTLDSAGKNYAQAGFDKNNIVQYGFSFGWENHPNYWGSFWQAGKILQGRPGAYTAVIPDAWKAAWQWVYDGYWGDQPYITNFNSDNLFVRSKVAMMDSPSWFMCCIGELANAGGTFQFGAMPTYNGAVGGRIDADSFRILKGSSHAFEAFKVLSYLVTDGVDKLVIGSADAPAPYTGIPAFTSKQQPSWDTKAAVFPFVTQASWDILKAGLNYPDVPSAEGYMPNINAAWSRIQGFGDLLTITKGVDLATEEAKLETDLTNLFASVNDPPRIDKLLPQQGLGSVPNNIYIYGENFAEGAVARLGSTDLQTISLTSSRLRAVVPQGLAAGIYAMTVTNPGGASATVNNAYTVFPDAIDDLSGYAFELWSDPSALRAHEGGQIGLVVHRQGGTSSISNVTVRFYLGDPDAGGTFLGDGSIALLAPSGAQATSGINWVPAEAGDYSIYAVIDPDNQFNETVETNNKISRTITVLPTTTDQAAPQVDSFVVNDGVNPITDLTVTLDTVVSDTGGSGVASLQFVQYQYSKATDLWVPVQDSGWLDYSTSQTNYEWELAPTNGVIYLQAWAMDHAGNISLSPFGAYVDYMPPTDTVGVGQANIYRYELSAGQSVTVLVTPFSGDPDLYIWAPDYVTHPRLPWFSDQASGAEEITFSATVTGLYQIEVHGYTDSEYSISVTLNAGTHSQLFKDGRLDSGKATNTQPYVALESAPGDHYVLPPVVEPPVFKVFLPLVFR